MGQAAEDRGVSPQLCAASEGGEGQPADEGLHQQSAAPLPKAELEELPEHLPAQPCAASQQHTPDGGRGGCQGSVRLERVPADRFPVHAVSLINVFIEITML